MAAHSASLEMPLLDLFFMHVFLMKLRVSFAIQWSAPAPVTRQAFRWNAGWSACFLPAGVGLC